MHLPDRPHPKALTHLPGLLNVGGFQLSPGTKVKGLEVIICLQRVCCLLVDVPREYWEPMEHWSAKNGHQLWVLATAHFGSYRFALHRLGTSKNADPQRDFEEISPLCPNVHQVTIVHHLCWLLIYNRLLRWISGHFPAAQHWSPSSSRCFLLVQTCWKCASV